MAFIQLYNRILKPSGLSSRITDRQICLGKAFILSFSKCCKAAPWNLKIQLAKNNKKNDILTTKKA